MTGAATVTLDEHPVTKQWAFSIDPRPDAPLPIQPFTKHLPAGERLDQAIRTAWEEVAKLATEAIEADVNAAIADLTPAAPTSIHDRPSYADWIPTEDPQRFASVRTVMGWTIDGYAINPVEQPLELCVTEDGSSILAPTWKQNQRPEALNYDTADEDRISFEIPPFNLLDEASVEAAFNDAVEHGLNHLSEEQQAAFSKLKKQLRILHFLDGFTTICGFCAFMLGARISYNLLGLVGTVIFTITVIAIYYRFGNRVLMRFTYAP